MCKQNDNPLVSVNILSYNRKDELRNTLTKVYEQDYKNIEVIVVDNASTDGSLEIVEKEFPLVKLIKLEKNIGVAGWNEGFKTAMGDYVLVLDDDAYPESDSVCKAIEEFNIDEKIACITFNVYDLRRNRFIDNDWSPSEKIKVDKVYWPVFIGCAAIFSMNKMNLRDIIPENYFLYQHELPVSAKIHNYGYKILFNKKIVAYHNFKDDKVYRIFKDSLYLKNNLLFINEYLPFVLAIPYTIQCFIFYMLRSVRRGWFRKYISIIFNNNYLIKKNNAISIRYFKELRKLHLFNFNLLSKLI